MDDVEVPDVPIATTIGAGLVLTDDTEVGIILMLGQGEDEDEHLSLAAISMNPMTTALIIAKLTSLLGEAEMAQEAVTEMGHAAALDYMKAWAKRNSARHN